MDLNTTIVILASLIILKFVISDVLDFLDR